MKPHNSRKKKFTYSLLVRSEEKERSVFETIAYSVCTLSVVVAIGQFVLQPVNLPFNETSQTVSTTQAPTVTAHS